jgi:hypothetical protein
MPASARWSRSGCVPTLRGRWQRRLRAPARARRFSTPSRDVAAAYLALAGGLAVERLVDPGAVPDSLFGEIVALVYQGLVARESRAS